MYDRIRFTRQQRPQIEVYTCHCDNKAGIDKLNTPLKTPGEQMAPDMDIIMAIKSFIMKHSITADFKHFKGHADKNKDKAECTRIEQLNIECDERAEECVVQNELASPFRPLPGSKCMVRIGDDWLTSRL